MIEELKKKIREPKESDFTLPKMSYSKLETFLNCPYSYKFKYKDSKYPSVSSLAMQIGTILHYALELKTHALMMQETEVDYDYIKEIVLNGTDDQKKGEHIIGINALKKEYFEDWYKQDENSEMNYEEKIQLFFDKVLPTRIQDENYAPVGAEVNFQFVYDDRIIFHGFIDRVDMKNDDPNWLRICDYKTSKKVFPDTKIKTPLQHIIYDLACVYMYGVIPKEHEYDFILLDKRQTTADGVCSKGYLKRGVAKIDKTLDEIEECAKKKRFVPKPSPLCYWCAYHSDSPFSDMKYKGDCGYHSLWTPDNKTFETIKKYDEKDNLKYESDKPKRKLIF